ncbi:hypothetical protein ES702_05234 [subsurface metagenome]
MKEIIILSILLSLGCKSRSQNTSLKEGVRVITIDGQGYDVRDGLLVKPLLNPKWPPRLPISKCKYNVEVGGEKPHFDCDDFSFTYKKWWTRNYPELKDTVWQVTIAEITISKKNPAHNLNILEIHPGGFKGNKFCLIEPQSNASRGCWAQHGNEGDPKIPSFLAAKMAKIFKWKIDLFQQYRTWNTSEWWGANCVTPEKQFSENGESVVMFGQRTGLDCRTMKPLDKDEQ